MDTLNLFLITPNYSLNLCLFCCNICTIYNDFKIKNNPQYVTEYRLISLSNVVSQIVTKVLANRLKTILPQVILDSQSAFVPERLITDNTIVAFEMLHKMRNRRRGKVGHMAVKLDISKAYDRVE